ncbi:hypothetical protein ABZ621_25080 [Streptomyces sp. NPDC007863]|uniref:hypothetical protein n=1 Tax=Streptomyces sp. NPDC007863 TaxID=3154894 RepID=UPI0033FDB73E
MGIESDRMVFDYLSEVGDLAQQRHLPPGDRSALVAGLRDEIDRRRATRGEESPTAVRGILGDLGTPDEVVTKAASGPGTPGASGPGTPGAASGADSGAASGTAPAPAAAWWSDTREAAEEPSTARAPVPHPRPGDVGAGVGAGDWVSGWGSDGSAADPDVPGFFGGIEAPELFRPPEPEAEDAEEESREETAPRSRVRRAAGWLLSSRPKKAGVQEEAPEEEAAPVRARGFAHPFLLLAAVLLIAGAAFGWLIALALGWLLAYGSRRLSPGQVKTAVFVLPGLAAAGGVVWLWGRVEGRWGEAVATGGDAMGQALAETWPWTLRAAALASAAYLLLRARRA